MYQRVPGTLADAITKAAAILTTEEMGKAAGVGVSSAQKWMNPTTLQMPSLQQCVLIDKACLKVANEAPINQFYSSEIGQLSAPQPTAKTLGREMLEVMAATGNLAGEVQLAEEKHASSGRPMSPNTAVSILQQAENVAREIQDIIHYARPFVPTLQ